jgi:hypothetical protein
MNMRFLFLLQVDLAGGAQSGARGPFRHARGGRGPPSFGIRIPFAHSGSSRVPTMSLLDGALLFGARGYRDASPAGLGQMRAAY